MSKRKKSDQTDWSEVDLKRLTLKDLRQLLQTREVKDIPNKRAEIEQVLKTTQVEIDYSEAMTMKQLVVELRLRGFDDSNARKETYLQRLRGEIAAPPKKKVKRGPKKRKHRAHGTKVFVSLYEKPADEEDDGTAPAVLGVFTHEGEAYDCVIDKLLEDVKKKRRKNACGFG